MKKYFKFLGLALLAAGMFTFTSCVDEETQNTVNEAEDGITVTFGETTWKAKTFNAKTSRETSGLTSGRYFGIKATPAIAWQNIPMVDGEGTQHGVAEAAYPMLWVLGEASKGTSDNNETEVSYLESAENTYAFADEDDDWDLYGWEPDSEDPVVVKVSDWNSSTLVISGTVNGTMYEINRDGDHTGESAELSVVFKNIQLVEAEDAK